jgi:hypothetical protein
MKNAAQLLVDKLPKLKIAFASLSKQDVLVGVPREDGMRKPEPGELSTMTNAMLAYIHDNGSPAANIPARPFMHPGIEAAKARIVTQFKIAGKKALDGDVAAIEQGLNKVGLLAQSSIRNAINEGIPPALATATIKGRIRARTAVKGAKMELASREAGNDAGTDNAKPLVATGQMRNAINFILRKK